MNVMAKAEMTALSIGKGITLNNADVAVASNGRLTDANQNREVDLDLFPTELFTRLPDLEVAGPPERLRSNFINGIRHLPVRFTPQKVSG